MAGKLREVRRRIRSVKSTQKITRAMELIAASRIVKAQARTEAAGPYAEAISRIVADLMSAGGGGAALLAPRESVGAVGVLAVTADRGLAGAYNTNVLRLVETERRSASAAGQGFEVYAYGRKSLSFYRYRRVQPAGVWTGVSDTPPYTVAKEIGRQLTDDYLAGKVDRVLVAYTAFRSMLVQRPAVVQLLPVVAPELAAKEGLSAEVEFEPSADAILESLLPRYVESRVFSALLDAAASEHAARRRAMKAATDNADELIKVLTRDANRARQAEITTEISEIVGGAEALAAKEA
ncbi:MAG: F0F1 ATP synthase subunit gamma [Mycobacteriales bacterium]|nr:F0F1 ATP synthase subunit gamma [Frankia sp.]